MDTKYLEYILEIAKQKNITRAAESLYVSQSSLSQHLLKLESELGVPLFTRTKNELVLTDAGQMYVQASKAVVQIKKTLYSNIAALRNEGCIRMGISSQWGVQMAADILLAFQEHFPHITLKIYENSYSQLKNMLVNEKIDLAMPASHPFCMLHAQEKSIAHSEICTSLRMESFIFSDEGSTIRLVEDELLKSLLFKPNVIFELNSNRATLAMVSKGAGIAFVPIPYAQRVKNIRIFRLDPALYRSNILVCRKNQGSFEPEKFLVELIKGYPLFHLENTD